MIIRGKIVIVTSFKEIRPGELFYFPQDDGTPTIRRAKENEDWNNYFNSKTGDVCYHKIKEIKGIVLSPREIFKL